MSGITLMDACIKYIIDPYLEDTKNEEYASQRIDNDDYADEFLRKLEMNEFHAYGNKFDANNQTSESHYEFVDKTFWQWFRKRYNVRGESGRREAAGVHFNYIRGYIGIGIDGRLVPHYYDDITIFECPRQESQVDTPAPTPSNGGRTAATGWQLVAAKAAQTILQTKANISNKEFLYILSTFVKEMGISKKFSDKTLSNLITEINKLCK
jgi:hypothetical protein